MRTSEPVKLDEQQPAAQFDPMSCAPKWRFSLRTVLIVIAWFSLVFAVAGHLFRSGLLPLEVGAYLAAIFTGAVLGTAYGELFRRPNRNRWIRSFASATLFGAVAFIIAFAPLGGMPQPAAWLMSLAFSTIPACLAASITEVVRMLTVTV